MSRSPIGLRNAYYRRQRLKIILIVTIVALIIFIVGYSVITFIRPPSKGHQCCTPSISVIRAPDGEMIGISDGSYVFDAKRGAEVLIYQEDKRILASHSSYMTIVVGTILTGPFADSGRDSLQGAYVAQKEYNDKCLADCLPVQLLIANSGSGQTTSEQSSYASLVAEQIVKARQGDKTIVGVMGWPISSDLFYGNTTLANAHIPVVSPTSLATEPQSGSSPYLFSVAPSNSQQGIVDAYYAAHFLHARRVAVFVDPVDQYSQSLADAFTLRFTSNENGAAVTKPYDYTVSSAESVQTKVQDVLSWKPDLIYFAGHANDLSLLLKTLPSCSNSSFCLQVLGGDGLYELGGYASGLNSYFFRLHFTAYAYPDEWDILSGSATKPPFFSDYSHDFNPKGDHPAKVYGYTRADSGVILSYDAMSTLINAASTTFSDQKTTFSPEDLQQKLMTESRQGISGKISFAGDGNPIDKAMVVLYFDNNSQIHEDQCFGTFLVSELQNSTSSTCTSAS